MIVPRYYENLSVLHENTMPARAYYIPASKRMDNLVEHREESDRMQLLNGTWKFQYFNSIYDIQDSFFVLCFPKANLILYFFCLRSLIILYIAYPNPQNMSMNWIRQNMH